MGKDDIFLIINTKVLPDVYLKVIEVKKLMESGKTKHVQDAVNAVGISRSVFYKYRDHVLPYTKKASGLSVTFSMNLDDKQGLLFVILGIIAEHKANILTINQTIQMNSVANVIITMETYDDSMDLIFDALRDIKGVQSLKILNKG